MVRARESENRNGSGRKRESESVGRRETRRWRWSGTDGDIALCWLRPDVCRTGGGHVMDMYFGT